MVVLIFDQLADWAAGTPEFARVIGENALDDLSRLIAAQRLLGPLRSENVAKIPADFDTGLAEMENYSEDALYLRIRDNPLAQHQNEALKFPENELRLLVDLIKKMLTYKSSERITAQEALHHKFFQA